MSKQLQTELTCAGCRIESNRVPHVNAVPNLTRCLVEHGTLQNVHNREFKPYHSLINIFSSLNALHRDRVVGPILQLKDELFQTFRQRRSIVSVQEYETDKASLERMLTDFEKDFAKPGQVWTHDLPKHFIKV